MSINTRIKRRIFLGLSSLVFTSNSIANVKKKQEVNSTVLGCSDVIYIDCGAVSSVASTINKCIKEANAYQIIKLRGSSNVVDIDQGIIVDKPISLDLGGKTLRKNTVFSGWIITIDACRYGIPSNPQIPATYTTPAWKSLTDNDGVRIYNGIIEGNQRRERGNGIRFIGGNSNVVLEKIKLLNFKGTAIALGDTADKVSNNYVQETDLISIDIKDCGDHTFPSFSIHRNDIGGSHTNNIRLNSLRIIYPRLGNAISISNENNRADVKNILFSGSNFIHGNRSLAKKLAGENTLNQNDLVTVKRPVAGGRIIRINFNNMRIIEQEAGTAAVSILSYTDVVFHNCEISSQRGGDGQAPRTGILLDGSGSVLLDCHCRMYLDEQVYIRTKLGTVNDRVTVGTSLLKKTDGGNVRLGNAVLKEVVYDLTERLTYVYD